MSTVSSMAASWRSSSGTDDPPDPGLAGDLLDRGLDFLAGPAGLAAGQGGGHLVEFLAGLGQGGAVEPAGLGGAQLR